ncbi:hypothetical protein BU25DRAFT_410420 [Macroventuria anomochaeta]|uniref:Uncharacterized protein n=1 Tax=Macroventuria anomochaeta TaxID=301207 RepID=A0ACB6S2Z3_9PLEO|nr:uncharacterized protein BU25DRAFT_410420 [Macroventuria anomochaeta]KAF2627764.1 hypothetical protein BU25DRAFT_410420 [Macroventuria anomochaeta]
MDQSYESLMSMSEVRPMIVSPHMSPQLNETICGCRCGCGCGCAGHGNGDDNGWMSDSETANDSNHSDDEGDSSPEEQTHYHDLRGRGPGRTSHEILSPRPSPYQEIVLLLGRLENLQIGEPSVGLEEVSIHSPLHDGYEDITEGLLDQDSSLENQSNAVPGRANVQMVSPGPGIGEWLHVIAEKTWLEDVQPVYIFTPLRLSAEYQHARGKAVEHLLVPDEESVPDLEQEESA